MSLKDQKEIIIQLLKSLFGKDDKISFYFLKKEKVPSKNESIIPFKTRRKVDPRRIKEIETLLRNKTGETDLRLIRWSDVISKIAPKSRIFKIPFFDSKNVDTKSHPWRLCPIGEHWVRRHPKQLNSGKITDHDGHCRENKKSKLEIFHADELLMIAQTHFESLNSDLEAMPFPDLLGFPNGNKYDLLIAGWTKFWNEVLKPQDPLDPDFVKALIATESSFNLVKDQSSHDGPARGLIQITESTRKILQDLKGELKNPHIELSVEESRDPVTNIGAGIRWLHYKKLYAKRILKREATWEDAVIFYKGLHGQIGKAGEADKIITKLRGYHKSLKNKRKKK